tara:strand:+ start:108 stop:1538 length:1431 start_codon:yes stop_codon:yes gene_type:complete
MKNYDIVIIGGGIAGIYSMYNLQKTYPKLKVLLLESNDRFGGRVYTYKTKVDNVDYSMDLGAGRLGHNHILIKELLHELNLEKDIINIPNNKSYIHIENNVAKDDSGLRNKLMKLLYNLLNSKKIKSLKNDYLQKFYFNEFLEKFISKKLVKQLSNVFEYSSDIYDLNAYDATIHFKNDYSNDTPYFILKNGLSGIINNMISKIIHNKYNFVNKNYKLKKNSIVKDIKLNTNNNNNNNNNSIQYNIKYYNKKLDKTIDITCKHLIAALPRKDLIKFDILNPYKNILNSINDINLLRIFEIYDTKDDVWFNNIGKTVINNEIQFVIPINSNNGLIMSSYCDNKNASYWLQLYKKSEALLKNVLNEKLNNAFGFMNKIVPKSKWIKFHYWDMGVACWKKDVNSDFLSSKIINLMPNFYICGENYSTYQAWCEGALMTSREVVNAIKCKLGNKSLVNTNKIRKKNRNNKTRNNKTVRRR